MNTKKYRNVSIRRRSFLRNHKFYKLHHIGEKCYLLFGFQFVHTCTMVSYIYMFMYIYYLIMNVECFTRYYIHVHVHVHIERSLMTIVRSEDTTGNEYSKFVCVYEIESTYFQLFPFLVNVITRYYIHVHMYISKDPL